ncbi:MAG TPA: cyclic nucleotide-binding domain-containing protein [Kofleriaceae bacterium]|nr:cyclic nucleotide-binding domain-containing protein [Kofleriaceae bacterium]
MTAVGEVKHHAIRLFGKGEALHALRLYDAIVAATPLDFEARARIADCLVALGQREHAIEVYRSVAWYVLKSGHPLIAIVIARVLEETLGADADDLLTALVMHYGNESGLLGSFAARINLPDPAVPCNPPELRSPPAEGFVAQAAQRAAHCCDDFDEYPEALHAIPLLSAMSEESFRKVIRTLVVRRLPDGAPVIRQGEPGQSFFFVASGEVRVSATSAVSGDNELARLHEGSIFGEMALLSAQPRSASVTVVGEADLLEVTRDSLHALAGELDQVGVALHQFTQERLLKNLMATNRLFKPFSRTQQRDLLRRFTNHEVPGGHDIIREGEAGTGLFVVLSGEVEVVKTGASGDKVQLATLRAGDVFGEMALIRGGPTTATVTATTLSGVLFLGRDYVERIIAGVPDIRAYLEALSEDRELDTQLALGADDDESPEDEIIFI